VTGISQIGGRRGQGAILALNEALAEQYAAIEVAPGLFVMGRSRSAKTRLIWAESRTPMRRSFSVGRGRGCARSVTCRRRNTGGGRRDLPPVHPAQRFFIAAASVWRIRHARSSWNCSFAATPTRLARVRATQPLRNAEPFFSAFGIEAGDPMWLPPEERIVIW
jgi:hypothetical protein